VYDLLKWLHDGFWDVGASVLGVCISVVGFAFTLVQVARSKSASEETQKAVAGVREKLELQTVATDLTALMDDIEEMKHLHRLNAWAVMPTRYATVRRKLVSVKATCPTLTRSQKSSIQGIIAQFKDIEDIVEQAIASNKTPSDVAALNKLAADQGDKLTVVLVSVQQEMKKK
jgi:hypothetical protein